MVSAVFFFQSEMVTAVFFIYGSLWVRFESATELTNFLPMLEFYTPWMKPDIFRGYSNVTFAVNDLNHGSSSRVCKKNNSYFQ